MSSTRFLLSTILVSLVLFSVIGCIAVNEHVAKNNGVEAKAKDGVFIHVSSGPENPHKVLMALAMAEKMSEDKDVLMYFDIKGINVLLEGAEDIEYSHFASSITQIYKLLERDVDIYACPGCLKAADKSAEDLMDGIKVANKEAFFNFTDGRILTLDY